MPPEITHSLYSGKIVINEINHTPDRFHQKWLRAKVDIKNLYLTGQDIITVGVTSAMFSGLLTASAILKKNLMKELIKK